MISKKIQLCLAFLAMFAAGKTQAQEAAANRYTKLYIGITGGISAPQGNFTKTDYSDPASGFAKTGGNIGLTGTYFFTKNWGINALVSYHGYGFHGAQNLADGYKEDFAVDSTTLNVNGSNHSINFLIGPYYSLPVAKKLFVDFRLLGGLSAANLAGNTVQLEDQEAATFSQDKATATAFAWQAGAALRYNTSKHFGVLLNVDYFSSKPNFSIENTNRANEAGRKITSYNQPIQGLNVNITLAWLLEN